MRNNIITAKAGDNVYIRTAKAFQYDYGIVLTITGIQLPEEYDVHFSNTGDASATVVAGDANGVAIPDAYFKNGEDIHAWVYLHTDDNDGETVYHIHIPIVKRPAFI